MILHISLPSREESLTFNRKRWAEVNADRELVASPNRIETNAWGQIIMTPPPGGSHCRVQFKIAKELDRQLGGEAFTECPISTIDGVRATDAAWYSQERYGEVAGQLAYEIAPEICVEVLSPQNNELEMRAKRQLYFDAGAEECWQCDLEGRMTYYWRAEPHTPQFQSQICPNFPNPIVAS